MCCHSPIVASEPISDYLRSRRGVIDTSFEGEIWFHLHCGVTRNLLKVLLKCLRVFPKIVCKSDQLPCLGQPNLSG